mmetsp:Transcript_14094/g.37947  ORF Transcript_14094/g.37947 Transcript_14094/m.37947 type:complete len:238 (-) Transcript_14094:803-1516(-)
MGEDTGCEPHPALDGVPGNGVVAGHDAKPESLLVAAALPFTAGELGTLCSVAMGISPAMLPERLGGFGGCADWPEGVPSPPSARASSSRSFCRTSAESGFFLGSACVPTVGTKAVVSSSLRLRLEGIAEPAFSFPSGWLMPSRDAEATMSVSCASTVAAAAAAAAPVAALPVPQGAAVFPAGGPACFDAGPLGTGVGPELEAGMGGTVRMALAASPACVGKGVLATAGAAAGAGAAL